MGKEMEVKCKHHFVLSRELTTKKDLAFICVKNCGTVKLSKRSKERHRK